MQSNTNDGKYLILAISHEKSSAIMLQPKRKIRGLLHQDNPVTWYMKERMFS